MVGHHDIAGFDAVVPASLAAIQFDVAAPQHPLDVGRRQLSERLGQLAEEEAVEPSSRVGLADGPFETHASPSPVIRAPSPGAACTFVR